MAIEGVAGGFGSAALEALRSRVEQGVPKVGPVGGDSAPNPHALLGGRGEAPDFGDVLSEALGTVTAMQDASKAKQMDLITGKDVAVHDVMATASEAGIAVQLTTAVTSKAIQAYLEIWRMEI